MFSLEHVKYDPASGVFYRLPARNGHKNKIGPITSNNRDGYIRFRLGKKTVYAHRIAFEIMGVSIPDGYTVDHINGEKSDNRWANLRAVSRRMNQQNLRVHRNGRLQGAAPLPGGRRFQAQIYKDGKQYNLGCFGSEIEAHNAYMKACKEIDDQ